MNTLTVKDWFGSGFQPPERWREGRGLSWLLRGGKQEEDLSDPFKAAVAPAL